MVLKNRFKICTCKSPRPTGKNAGFCQKRPSYKIISYKGTNGCCWSSHSLWLPEVYFLPQNHHKILGSLPLMRQIQFFPDVTFQIYRFWTFLEIILKHLGSFLRLATLVQNWAPPTLSIISWSDPEKGGNIFWSCTKLKLIQKRGSLYLQCHLSESSSHVNHICIVIPRGWVEDAEYFFCAISPFFVPRRDIQSFWP